MNNAIIICYDGDAVKGKDVSDIQTILTHRCNAVPDTTVIKVFDADSIAKVLLKKSAEDLKISFTEDSDAKTVCITLDTQDCEERLRAVKCIKESLDCGLKEAKEMFDHGQVYIPRIWSDRKMYAFIKDLNVYKIVATGGMEDVAMVQAAIFLNETYGKKDHIALVRDFAEATYHSHTNSADEKEQALLTAVALVKSHPTSADRWVSSELVNVINSL
jgi:ribosomal protein L7/L12